MDPSVYLPQLNAILARHGFVLAYLFGSQAQGEIGPLSDVAVLLSPGAPQSDGATPSWTLLAN